MAGPRRLRVANVNDVERPGAALYCARPNCDHLMPPRAPGAGRPRRYCSDECTELVVSDKRAVDAALVHQIEVARQYGPVSIGPPVSTPAQRAVVTAAAKACAEVLAASPEDMSPDRRRVLEQARVALDLASDLIKPSRAGGGV